LPAKATVAIAAATGGCFKCAVKVVDQLINSLFFVRACLLNMPPYIARPHPWADKFVSGDFSDGFGELAFVYRGPPANQLDGSFLIRFVCKEIPHHSRFSESKVVTRMFHPAGIVSPCTPRAVVTLN
jgi:hypothetical protein